MKTLLLNPCSGIAGDMLVGALLDLGADTPQFWTTLRTLPLPAASWQAEVVGVQRFGIGAKHYRVSWHEGLQPVARGKGRLVQAGGAGHAHRRLPEVLAILAGSGLSERAQAAACRTFQLLAEAEGQVHGIAPAEVHFHEVGAVDAIADIAGACLAADLLDVGRVISGPVALGSGTVKCEHGVMPVPAPAVARLLIGVPTLCGTASGELTTPTGAALLRGLGAEFVPAPPGRLLASGYGAGTKDFPGHANVLQALLLETAAADPTPTRIVVLECTVDDMTGELLGHLVPRLLAAGALDAALFPCTMKKGRPGIQVQVLAEPARREALARLLLAETTTFGVRWHEADRLVLRRAGRTVATAVGELELKLGYCPESGRLLRVTPEYESCRAAAERTGRPLAEVYALAQQAAQALPAEGGLT
jgi:uncharacterized protein (TIGR00299 family) protein